MLLIKNLIYVKLYLNDRTMVFIRKSINCMVSSRTQANK